MQFTENDSSPPYHQVVDPHRDVLVTSLELVQQAKEVAYDDDTLFNCLFDMILDYQKTRFDLLKWQL